MTSEWALVSVDDIKARQQGSIAIGPFGSRMKSECYVSQGIRVVRGTNLTGGREFSRDFVCITPEKAKELNSANLRANDLVFPHRGAIGEVGIVPNDGTRYVISSSLMKLTCDSERALPDFLYYFFKSEKGRFELLKNSSQVGTPGIGQPLTSLKQIQLRLPPIHEQKAIVALLRALDDRIALLRETNATLEAIAQALFKSWFVDFDPVHAKQQGIAPAGMDEATAALFPDSFEESALGSVPRGWSQAKVSDVADIVKGKSYSSRDLVLEHDTALVTLKSFERGGGFRLDGFKPYSGLYKNGQVVVSGDLIVAYTDVTQAAELIGKPAIVVGVSEYKTLVASLDVGIVRPLEKCTSRQFLYGLFRTESFQAHTLSHTSGTTVLHLSKDGVGSYQFARPPAELIAAFSSVAESLARQRQVNIDQFRTLATLRDTLLPRLISGQLRLPQAETPAASCGAR